MKLTYRPEIDGLRTIAVLAVIIYHLDVVFGNTQLLQGGFLGVDIFFVISGFLITSIIMSEYHNTQGFSLVNFYERRARRLLPALFIVILVSLPFAWYLLLPSQLEDFAKSILSTLAFGSNFYWDMSLQEYGAESAQLKPFLHTWTLAVEEQYYIFFPLILLAIYKWWKSHTVVILLALLLLSLQFAEYMTPIDHSFSYYMLPTRFWELLAGSLLANILYYHPKEENDTPLNKTMPILGLYLIVHSVFFVEFESNHPGFITLLPVIGTILIIWFANKDELVTKILSCELFVGIGLVSYSLYLWHYPIFAFGRIVDASPTWHDKTQWLLLTLLLSSASYLLIEKPFRNKNIFRTRIFFALTAGTSILIISLSAFLTITVSEKADFLSYYFDQTEYRSFKHPEGSLGTNIVSGKKSENCNFRDPREACLIGDGKIVTLGDSYVSQYDRALHESLGANYGLISLTAEQCPLISDSYLLNSQRTECPKINRLRWQVIKNFKEKIFIVSTNEWQFFRYFSVNETKEIQHKELTTNPVWKSYIKNIKSLTEHGHKVIVIMRVPEPGFDAKSTFISDYTSGTTKPYLSTADNTNTHKQNSIWFKELEDNPNVLLIAPSDYLCNDKLDKCVVIEKDASLYNQGRHLSFFGAKIIVDSLLEEAVSAGWIK